MCLSEESQAWKHRLSLNIQILMLMLITQSHPIPRVIRLAVAHFCWFLSLDSISWRPLIPAQMCLGKKPFWFWNTVSVSVALAWLLQELEINCSPCQENWNTTWNLDARDPYHHSCRVARGGWGRCTSGRKTGFPAEMLLEPQNTTAISDPVLSSPPGGWGWVVRGVSLGQHPTGQQFLRDPAPR